MAKPVYDESVGKAESARRGGGDHGARTSSSTRPCVSWSQSGQASTSMLQRRFRIGFSRAGRLVDMHGARRHRRPGGRLARRARSSSPPTTTQAWTVMASSARAGDGQRPCPRLLGASSLAPCLPPSPPQAEARAASAPRPRPLLRARSSLATRSRPRPPERQERRVGEGHRRFRLVVSRYPQSGYCDDALLAVGDIYRAMAASFCDRRYLERPSRATARSRIPDSSLGEPALYSAFEIARAGARSRKLAEAGRRYLEAFPTMPTPARARRAQQPRLHPAARACPSAATRGWRKSSICAPGAARRRRAWCSISSARSATGGIGSRTPTACGSTSGTRLHPNLTRTFPGRRRLLERSGSVSTARGRAGGARLQARG